MELIKGNKYYSFIIDGQSNGAGLRFVAKPFSAIYIGGHISFKSSWSEISDSKVADDNTTRTGLQYEWFDTYEAARVCYNKRLKQTKNYILKNLPRGYSKKAVREKMSKYEQI